MFCRDHTPALDGGDPFWQYLFVCFPLCMQTHFSEGLATQICQFYFLSLCANLFANKTFFFSLFGLLDFLIFLFSPAPSLYIHTLFAPFTCLGKRRDIKYRYITCFPLVPAANIDMLPLSTFYFHSHYCFYLFLTRKKIFLLLSFSLISYFFSFFSTLFFLPLTFSFPFFFFLALEQNRQQTFSYFGRKFELPTPRTFKWSGDVLSQTFCFL